MNTRSPQMIGLAADGPGNWIDHFTLSVLENFVGRPVSGEEPLKSGPRHCGQFSARAGKSRKKTIVETRADGTAARDVLKNCVVKFKGAMVCPIANHSMEHKPIWLDGISDRADSGSPFFVAAEVRRKGVRFCPRDPPPHIRGYGSRAIFRHVLRLRKDWALNHQSVDLLSHKSLRSRSRDGVRCHIARMWLHGPRRERRQYHADGVSRRVCPRDRAR